MKTCECYSCLLARRASTVSNFFELDSDLYSIFTRVSSIVDSLLSTFKGRSACSVSGLRAAASSPTCEDRPPILRSTDALKSRVIFLMVSNLGSIFSLFSSQAGVVPRRGRLDEDEDILGVADGRGRIGIRDCSAGCRLCTSPGSDSDQSSYTESSSVGVVFSAALASSSSSSSARRTLSLILVAISACNTWVFALC